MYFPLFLDSSGRKFLIIGGGKIAQAKLETISEFSKNITIVAEEISPQIAQKNFRIVIRDSYNKKYLGDADIVIAATNNKDINRQIAKDAKAQNKLVNVVDDAKNSDFIFGANIKRGEIILSVATSGISPVLARLLKQKLQNFLPQNFALLSEFLERNKNSVKEKLKNIQARRLFWQEVLEGVIANEILAGNINKAQFLLTTKLENSTNKKESAVYFIGAGPGDPELITVKAINFLSKADIVLYDRLVAPAILAYARKDALKINVGKTRNFHRNSQEEINQLIRKFALEGNIVARLKGGDAGIFARLSEEIDAISNLKIPYQIVPGITAASGAAAYAGIPLTSRNANKSVRFLTIYDSDLVDLNYWRELAKSNDTLALYMSSHNLATIINHLILAGKKSSTPLAIIEQATTPFQKTFTSNLKNFRKDFGEKKFISPALVIIGDVVNQRYEWREENLSGNYFQKLEVGNG
ncbi:MAG: uroporphyrinogen-III C-methyltransferase [Alphaproteobacteria bacterium RIFCSPLOWO2_01_FULL_40_26]|nr:MAG: uroporphyrinogen-III C-methyltransferase [Alphaproteobacteria bacterium RIFCSPHIGHO2_02_FULL_40_34]OFW88471.1 MAG: uroporphyrinogen-III C-methyltransferase [Alphaproteobacteria bacterium RIFCSPHIGHO2_01_FULL_40_8]OFW95250.1 MAG: uroporphyrinogen-III C-methyltransferase [Alphaproteobacteria bacterium RIFCSPLOWO2_01_FULL_40_26]OFX09348.1 MAG: uroporphyrinogen-III C-methyltransferase [Alphaproteobacteria bacterium RIFCSPLOWO2_02_FULL_40_19]OFX11880.1 MAG: uroporphyrinogen-III C-methyltrans